MIEDTYIARALGFYIKATGPADIKLADAVAEAKQIVDFTFDIDKQVAFRKGFEAAEEMIEDNGGGCSEKHFHELNRMQKILLSEVLFIKTEMWLMGQSVRHEPPTYQREPLRAIPWPGVRLKPEQAAELLEGIEKEFFLEAEAETKAEADAGPFYVGNFTDCKIF